MKPILTITILTLIIFISCDCLIEVSGTVVDSKTKKPIINASVEDAYMNWGSIETDEQGDFSTVGRTVGLLWCFPLYLEICKEGYESKVVKISHKRHKKIKLKPITE